LTDTHIFNEVTDFKEECDDIAALLTPLTPADFDRPTLFKNWTIGDILAHLHLWNIAADLTLSDPDKFDAFSTFAFGILGKGGSHIDLQAAYYKDRTHMEIFRDWQAYYPEMSARFGRVDPSKRVKWAGPDMSVKSCIIARQMEHWAHAQAIFDVLGLERQFKARLKNIAHIGVTTYSWSFKVNQLVPRRPKPYVKLHAPNGDIWQWNDPQDDNKVEGLAHEFCQVVTQCRNIADTRLVTTGEAATEWMQIAQCFAGGPETPPAKDQRKPQA